VDLFISGCSSICSVSSIPDALNDVGGGGTGVDSDTLSAPSPSQSRGGTTPCSKLAEAEEPWSATPSRSSGAAAGQFSSANYKKAMLNRYCHEDKTKEDNGRSTVGGAMDVKKEEAGVGEVKKEVGVGDVKKESLGDEDIKKEMCDVSSPCAEKSIKMMKDDVMDHTTTCMVRDDWLLFLPYYANMLEMHHSLGIILIFCHFYVRNYLKSIECR